MIKELDALNKFLKDYLSLCEKLNTNRQEKMLLDSNSPYNILKKYLEDIDNIKSDDAMKSLELLGEFSWFEKPFKDAFPDLFNTIEQSLIQGRKDNEDINLIVSKTVCMEYIKESANVEEYNTYIMHRNPISYNECKLTEEEFYRLKERKNNE